MREENCNSSGAELHHERHYKGEQEVRAMGVVSPVICE